MVFDGEHDKPLRVLLQQRLIGLLRLECGGDGLGNILINLLGLCRLSLLDLPSPLQLVDLGHVVGGGIDGLILLVLDAEIGILDGMIHA